MWKIRGSMIPQNFHGTWIFHDLSRPEREKYPLAQRGTRTYHPRRGGWGSRRSADERRYGATRTGPPAGSTRASQPASRCTGRPGISRTSPDRARSRPSCQTSSRATRRNSALRSTNRPSRGGTARPPTAIATAFGEIHRRGGSAHTGTEAAAGPAPPVAAGPASPRAAAAGRRRPGVRARGVVAVGPGQLDLGEGRAQACGPHRTSG